MVLKDHVRLAAADLAVGAVDEGIGQLFATVELQKLFFVDGLAVKPLAVKPLAAELAVN
jgi:hypothetical protein